MKTLHFLKTRSLRFTALIIAGALFSGIVACNNKTNSNTTADSAEMSVDSNMSTTNPVEIKPTGPAPSWAPTIKPEMQAVMEKLQSYGDKPVETLTASEARKNHTPTDAVMDLVKEFNITLPPSGVDTAGIEIPVSGGSIHARTYTPKTGNGPFPIIVYYHGGGFVIANLDVYDASAKGLAEQVGAVVVSVAYRMGPEHKFPIAHNDSFAAYQWVVKNTASIKGDAKKIAVVGESAGGNLAVNMAIMARDKGIPLPIHILAIYPIANSDINSESYKKNANAKPLSKAMMAWFNKNYLNTMAEAKDPRITLVNANLKGLPPTTIITAEIDPLQSDGMLLAEKLKAADVKVESKNYDGVTHEFFGMGAVVPEAKEAMMYGAGQLKSAFGM
jgi:acetyl esterase/lipase